MSAKLRPVTLRSHSFSARSTTAFLVPVAFTAPSLIRPCWTRRSSSSSFLNRLRSFTKVLWSIVVRVTGPFSLNFKFREENRLRSNPPFCRNGRLYTTGQSEQSSRNAPQATGERTWERGIATKQGIPWSLPSVRSKTWREWPKASTKAFWEQIWHNAWETAKCWWWEQGG